jgi:predicted ABC-type ATPase
VHFSTPHAVLIAGPNGAGKTTFAQEFVPEQSDGARFHNATLIASGLPPFDPDRASLRAGRLLLTLLAEGHGLPVGLVVTGATATT